MPVIRRGQTRLIAFADNDIERRMVFDWPPGAEGFGWEDVRFTPQELDALVEYADAGMIEEASKLVDAAYDRLFGLQEN